MLACPALGFEGNFHGFSLPALSSENESQGFQASGIISGGDLTVDDVQLGLVEFSKNVELKQEGPQLLTRRTDLHGRSWNLTDLLDDRVYERSGDELADQGLFVALPPWGCHLLAML